MPRAIVNGVELEFARLGDGPRLLFCNGSGSTIESARPLIDLFAARFEVLVHDQRGLGGSEIPIAPWSMADCAADGLALLDHVGWTSCLVAGVSFGGMVAQELAVTAPARVERLALLCTSAGGAGGSSYPLHELEALPADERIARGLEILDRRFTGDWLATHPNDQAIVSTMAATRAAPLSEERQRGAAGQLEARRRHDVYDRLGAITCPSIVACGRYDGIAPLENSEAIAARIPDAELRVYEGGHLFFLQDRQALPEIFAFLAP